jgi:outer membrane protein OmpA-like peptidoglycan-associated protein
VFGSPFTLCAGLGPGLGQGAGAGEWHALARAGWAPLEKPAPPDADEDGVPDASDACRAVFGIRASDPLMNGCPELPIDRDGDAIPDALDACRTTPGVPAAEPRLHGCPRPSVVKPSAPTPEPEPSPRAALERERIVLRQQIQFETGTAAIRPESTAILDEVAKILELHPELELVEVQGHTDETGTPEFNRQLSLHRARAVRSWLLGRGIAEQRLSARGLGADVPIDTNQSEQGRSRNRRVEFHVLRRSEEPGEATP